MHAVRVVMLEATPTTNDNDGPNPLQLKYRFT